MSIRTFGLLLVFTFSSAFAAAQVVTEPQPLVPDQAVERELSGGESHPYQIQLAAGQFVHFRLDQRAINAALTLHSPDGKQLVEMNLTRAGSEESLSLEAAVAGLYRLTVRGEGPKTGHGTYRLETLVKAAASD